MWVSVRKIGGRIESAPVWNGMTRLLVLGLCFGLGTLAGFCFSGWCGSPELQDYLHRYFQAAGQEGGAEPPLWACVWDLARWPLAAFLLGSTTLGVAGVPALMGARGFLLAFSTATFARLFGLPGVAASLTAFGVSALIAVPVLFIVAADAFEQSLGRLAGERPPAWGQRARTLAPCAGLLVLAAALQQTLAPALLTAVCARFFIT